MNKNQTEKEAEPAAVTLTDPASVKQCLTNRCLKKQDGAARLKRLPDVDERALFQGSIQAVGKPAEFPLQRSGMIPEIRADIDHSSAGFVAPKVHGCGYDLLRFEWPAGDAASMGTWMHGTMGDKLRLRNRRFPDVRLRQ